ncbi:hypothetical protein [Arcanobacterium canis]
MTTYKLDNIPLDDPDGRWRLENQGSKPPAPAMPASTLLPHAFIDGATAITGGHQTRTLNLNLWIPNTTETWTSHDGTTNNLAALAAVIAQAKTVAYVPDGALPERTARVLSRVISEPNWIGRRGALVAVQLTIAPFWAEAQELSESRALTNGVVAFPRFAGATAPLEDAVIRVAGAARDIQITCPVNETGFIYKPLLRSGDTLEIDIAQRKVAVGGREVDYSYPISGFLKVEPRPSGLTDPVSFVELNVSAQSISKATVQLAARRWHR